MSKLLVLLLPFSAMDGDPGHQLCVPDTALKRVQNHTSASSESG